MCSWLCSRSEMCRYINNSASKMRIRLDTETKGIYQKSSPVAIHLKPPHGILQSSIKITDYSKLAVSGLETANTLGG